MSRTILKPAIHPTTKDSGLSGGGSVNVKKNIGGDMLSNNEKLSMTQKNLRDMQAIVACIEFGRSPKELMDYLASTDYFYAPASSSDKNHGWYYGGLYEHSKRVYKILKYLNEYIPQNKRFSDETVFYCAFCHDLAKIDYYKDIKKWRKDNNGKWEPYDSWEIEDSFPCGHGAKSTIIANRYVKLTDNEIMAINYHMGAYNETNYYILGDARKMTPLVYMLHSADVLSIDLLERYLEPKSSTEISIEF